MSGISGVILFFHLCFGLCFAYRTYTLRSQKIFSNISIKSCIFSYLLILLCSTQGGVFIFVLSIYIPILLFITFEYMMVHKRTKVFQHQFIILLDSVIARMKMGISFREALELGIDQIESKWVKDSLRELQDQVIYTKDIGTLSQSFHSAFFILKKAHQETHLRLSQLQYVRNHLKINLLFHKKVHQALLQIRLQSLVMSVLYLGVLIFIILYSGTKFLQLILFSMLLFVLGSLFVFSIGRKIKWTL